MSKKPSPLRFHSAINRIFDSRRLWVRVPPEELNSLIGLLQSHWLLFYLHSVASSSVHLNGKS